MGQFSNVLLAIDKVHTVSQTVMYCRPGGLNQVYGHNSPTTPSVQSIFGKYINIFTTWTNKKRYDIIMTAVANVSNGQIDMSYNTELRTLTKHIRHQVCPGETCHRSTSESGITMLIPRGKSNCGVTYYVSIYY